MVPSVGAGGVADGMTGILGPQHATVLRQSGCDFVSAYCSDRKKYKR
ncbi:hypothetical protein LMG18101_00004 [Ralstonia flaminis]|uniref:Uncharacterized protein n=1 Tax=Ralstonia flaminis TaxID=3058597 RepID=A0ABM9JWA6_9RALS|nr:hypothetical protein LMG18101_00004 [Ralstonia sp. LMG 18101]